MDMKGERREDSIENEAIKISKEGKGRNQSEH